MGMRWRSTATVVQSAFPRQRLTMRYTVLRRSSRATERTRHDRFYAQPIARRDNNRKLGLASSARHFLRVLAKKLDVSAFNDGALQLPSLSYAAGKKATACDKFMRAIDDNPRFVAVPPTGWASRSSERGGRQDAG